MSTDVLEITLYRYSTAADRLGLRLEAATGSSKADIAGEPNSLSTDRHGLSLPRWRLFELLMRRSEAFQTMLASEGVLRKDWDHPEEDAAWDYL